MAKRLLIEKEEEVSNKLVQPNNPEEQLEIARITVELNRMYDQKHQTWREFNDRTLQNYCDDNEKRINNYVPPRDESFEDWQTKGFEGVTREKMFAFVAKVAMKRPEYKYQATRKDGFIDRTVAEVIEDFSVYSRLHEDPTGVQFFFDAWDAAGHGTSIRYEGVEMDESFEEEFDSYDVATGKIEGLRTIEKGGEIHCKSRRVRLMDFYWDDWYEPDIQKQGKIAEIKIMSRYAFESQFGGYYNADKVPSWKAAQAAWDTSFYMKQSENTPEDRICVVFWYEKTAKKTKYRIIANGVLILATPIWRKDGKYPYSRGIFKPHADSNFFCGKALPDEIAWDQDLYNAIKNMMVDRSILHIQRPMITDGDNEFTDVWMSPSKILNVKGNVKPLDIEGISAADLQVLEYLRGSMDRQTSDAQQSGFSGSGSTAREIVIADENARKLAGVFRLFLEEYDMQGEQLRIGNIFQFYFEPIKVQEILDKHKQAKLSVIYKQISLKDRKLSDGVTGVKTINIIGKKTDKRTDDELKAEMLAAKEQGFDLEPMDITASYIKNHDVDLIVIPESTWQSSRSLGLAMENEYLASMAQYFPQKLMQYNDVFFKNYNDVYEKDTSEFEDVPQQQQPVGPNGQPMQPPTQPGAPQQSTGVSAQLANQQPSLGQLTGA